MPGFGFSYPSSTFDFSMRHYVNVVLHVIEKLSAGPSSTLMFPCAWSYVAFLLATEQPAFVERLVVSQCPHWDEEQVWSKRIDSQGMIGMPVIGQLFLAMNQKRVSDSWYGAALPKGRVTEEFAEPARKVLSDGGIFCLASLTQTWSHIRNPSFLVDTPTVVMWGGSDRTHRRSDPDSVLQYLKRGMVIKYPAAGHFPELEDPEAFRSLLLNEELWSGLRMRKINPKLEGDSKHNGISTDIGRNHVVPLAGPRKPLDSHL